MEFESCHRRYNVNQVSLLGCLIFNPGVMHSKPSSGSKVNSAFNPPSPSKLVLVSLE